jgi:hypothetical protein
MHRKRLAVKAKNAQRPTLDVQRSIKTEKNIAFAANSVVQYSF